MTILLTISIGVTVAASVLMLLAMAGWMLFHERPHLSSALIGVIWRSMGVAAVGFALSVGMWVAPMIVGAP
jgi:hypothetical protein